MLNLLPINRIEGDIKSYPCSLLDFIYSLQCTQRLMSHWFGDFASMTYLLMTIDGQTDTTLLPLSSDQDQSR